MSELNRFFPALLRGLTCDGELGQLATEATSAVEAGEGVIALDASRYEGKEASECAELLKADVSESARGSLKAVALGGTSYVLAPNIDVLKSRAQGDLKGEGAARSRVVVVTGGAQGFGEGIVRSMAETGHLVYVADLNVEKAGALCDEINEQLGHTATQPIQVNVADEASVAEMVDAITAQVGGIDVFVNNAGVLKADSVKTMTSKDFEFVTDVNYRGYFYCVKAVSKVMEWMNLGAQAYFTDIIQINSKSGLQGSNKNGAYAGGKFGGIGLTQSFAMELVADNTKVNAICPGNFFEGPLWSDPDRGLFAQYLNTGKVPGAKTIADVKAFYEAKVPMGRGCRVADVMRALYYIIEQKYETGQALPVTGGQVMLK